MEHEDGTVGGGRAVARRLEVTGQDVRLADPVVGQKSIGCRGVGQSWQTNEMLWPIALLTGATSLRSRLFRRASAKLQPASSRSNHASDPSDADYPTKQ